MPFLPKLVPALLVENLVHGIKRSMIMMVYNYQSGAILTITPYNIKQADAQREGRHLAGEADAADSVSAAGSASARLLMNNLQGRPLTLVAQGRKSVFTRTSLLESVDVACITA